MNVAKIDFVVGDLRAVIVCGGSILFESGWVDLVDDGESMNVATRRRVNDGEAAIVKGAAKWN